MRAPLLALILALPGTAWAQNALDANLHAAEGKANPSATKEDYRSRNLVVTGDVAGGRGFRGNVGYTAEGDFRGATGGDSSIRFRRDSALSSSNLARSQSAGDTFSMMRDSGALEYRRDFVGSSRRGATSTSPTATARQRLDQESNRLATERLLSIDTGSNPMARYQSRTGDTGTLTAGTVRGVKRESDRIRKGTEGLNLYEAARLQDDLRKGLLRMDAVHSSSVSPFAISKSADAVRSSSIRELKPMTSAEMSVQRVGAKGSTYDAMVGRIRSNWEQVPAGRKATAKKSEETPRDGADAKERKPIEPADGAAEPKDDGLEDAYQTLRRRLDRGKTPEVDPRDERDGPPAETGPVMTAEEYALLLKHGTKLDAFGEDGKGRLDELLREGQRSLREGNNFIAEKRFEVALLLKQDDPRATAGLLHCQIGANLPGSASLTLRKLFTQSPEMMDVVYGPEALPPADRVTKALESARARMKAGRDAADYGLLVAYIGRLLGDRAAIEEGLAQVKGTPGDDTLAGVLRKLWLDAPAAPKAP